MLLYGIIVFLSAFLLFQVQPIVAKMILPWFGGSSAVWNTCMLFFQAALLAGYLYAHWVHSRLNRLAQAGVHTVLLLASLAALPIIPSIAWKPTGVGSPSWHILALLAVTIGLPYFLLSTTTPLVQAWYAGTHVGAMPYRLFALSNAASMLALLSYPPLVEPYLPVRLQAQIWSAAYACFVVLCGVLAWLAYRANATSTADAASQVAAAEQEQPIEKWRYALWAALAACPCILLLSITTFLTMDVAPIPFLWILPLSIYLLSFIICFESPRLYWRPLFLALLPVALVLAAYRMRQVGHGFGLFQTIAIMASSLFVFSMVCHGELAQLKPSPRRLTGFYLMVALGGAVGGLFVALLAPSLFDAYYEFPFGLALCGALAVTALFVQGVIGRNPLKWSLIGVALAAYVIYMGIPYEGSGVRMARRNFYGRLVIYDRAQFGVTPVRYLFHGVISHGQQVLDNSPTPAPLAYYCPQSGVGAAMRTLVYRTQRKIGMLGLGCGSLLAYGRRGDVFRIYEINPLVVELAWDKFDFLRTTQATFEMIMGDARLSLEREPSQQFDLLVMDAFSGDSVPVHLLTREAFQTYFRHLKPDGILAVHVSNTYLNLKPVVERAAAAAGKIPLLFDYLPMEPDSLCYSCTWVLLINPAIQGRVPALASGTPLEKTPGFREWTDDFSDMRRILR